MQLIADSGSTKTDWRMLADDGSVGQARTVGFNPFYQSSEQIAHELKLSLKPKVKELVTAIFFYGAGVTGAEKAQVIMDGLKDVFPEAEHIEAHSDMLGAARALCGREKGIACILGTGSNTCQIENGEITHKVDTLGFWLGDEGSGGYLGKTLVQTYLHKELPQALHEKFEKRYPNLNRDVVLENAYQKPFPNRYFAGFSKFLFDNRTDAAAYQIAANAFGLFFEKYVQKYPDYSNYRVSLTGSVAFYYSDIIRRVAREKNITIGVIMETPIAGLTLYHQGKS
ncbi:N-acetylglucosamine kinase [Siphonobacter sp. SORGH_AS_0500]|uniref:N-acetylglucosamine kinase n=2 Tax=Siphonobacter sp. SORGH_AS_0500 TaxID=1864824 RepID=UPI002858D9FF|nr:N-acetylglucosamine kinase [Siphonobacter sp. SORGH_AS_0500]MDR6197023.1 glucosamine kinase [Siphonobacter sp. SORGH_AS_0500]